MPKDWVNTIITGRLGPLGVEGDMLFWTSEECLLFLLLIPIVVVWLIVSEYVKKRGETPEETLQRYQEEGERLDERIQKEKIHGNWWVTPGKWLLYKIFPNPDGENRHFLRIVFAIVLLLIFIFVISSFAGLVIDSCPPDSICP